MARPLSEAKRSAILRGAIEVIAAQGVGAPTAKIAELAGVAEGSLFRYYRNKDALLNGVYLQLKAELRSALLTDFPVDGSTLDRSRHIWNRYVNWGAAHPSHRRAMSQLAVSDLVTEDSRQRAREGFEAFGELLRNWTGLCGTGCPQGSRDGFASAMLTAIADTTIDFMAREPNRAAEYADVGFNAFWRAASGDHPG